MEHLKSEGDINLTSRRTEWMAQNLDPETRYWLEEDARYFLHQALSTPCLDVLKGADGPAITTLRGRQLLDFHGNNVHQVGFGHPRIIEAITRQMHELAFCTRRYTNIPAIQLAKRLTSLAPGDLNRLLFAPGGTSAIGMALKLARSATGRHKTISMWDSFHGASLDAISIGGEAIFRKNAGPLLSGCEHVPPPDPRHCLWECGASCSLKCADYIEYILKKEGDIAAVVAETIRCTPFIPPFDYWKKVRAACDKYGALLILDEIPIGLGRTGRMFACEHYDVVPDMLVLGKGLGGGIFPLAALIAREGLNVAADQALGHYTHEKNPVACAAGLAVLDLLEQERLVERAATLGQTAIGRLRAMQKELPLIGDVRGLGLLLGVELVTDPVKMTPANDEAERVMYLCMTQGLNFKITMGNILTLTPALTLSHTEMDQALNILKRAIQTVSAKPHSEPAIQNPHIS